MAEWSNAPVLKTDELRGSGGSNPSLSAQQTRRFSSPRFVFSEREEFVQSVAFRVTNLRVAVVCCRKSLSLPDDCL